MPLYVRFKGKKEFWRRESGCYGMKKAPFMQFYVSDYLNDSKVKLLSLSAQGLYIRILACLWLESEPFLPYDEKVVARIVSVSDDEFLPPWRELWREGYELFTLTATKTMFTQKRLLAEWEKMSGINYARREAQKKSVEARKKKAEKFANALQGGTKGLCNGGDSGLQGGTNEISELADSKELTPQSIAKDLQTNSKTLAKPIAKNCYTDTDTDTDTDSDTDSYSDTESEKGLKDIRNVPRTADAVVAEASSTTPCPHLKIIELYHRVLPELPAVVEWTEARKKMLAQRWREKKERQNLEWWERYFYRVKASDFLTGKVENRKGSSPFLADLEWLIRPSNLPKVIEGRYDNRKGKDIYQQASEMGLDECIKEFYSGFEIPVQKPQAVMKHD